MYSHLIGKYSVAKWVVLLRLWLYIRPFAENWSYNGRILLKKSYFLQFSTYLLNTPDFKLIYWLFYPSKADFTLMNMNCILHARKKVNIWTSYFSKNPPLPYNGL